MRPERIGPYRLEKKLGAGGMGVVYAAWDERLERRVALKQIRPEMAGAAQRTRFRREARAVARLDHAAIVRIYDLVATPECDWLVLQYVEGPTLAERLRQGPPPPEQVVTVARDVLGALRAAHSQGLLHRDLKAENVVLAASGHALVLDFGLAKLYAAESGDAVPGEAVTATAGVVGTYRAMSPEQANGLALDPRSDLFSAGVLLYEAATGSSPFRADTPVATLNLVCTHLQTPARELVPTISAPLSALIDALLEKDADRRPRSADKALAWIEAGMRAPTVTPPPDADETVSLAPCLAPLPAAPAEDPAAASGQAASPPSYRSFRRRRGQRVAGLALLGLVAAVGLFVAWRPRLPRRQNPPHGPLYVAVARPEVGLGAGREEVAPGASG